MSKNSRGIPCGKCGMRGSRVVRTVTENGYVLRRRECKACRARFTTTERIPGGKLPADMQGIAISVGQLCKSLGMQLPISD